MRKSDGFFHIGLDFRHLAKIVVDVNFGFVGGYAQLFGQSILRNAVNNAEIDCFGMTAQIMVDLIGRHAENLGGRCRMNVNTVVKRLFQCLDAGNDGHQPQLNLRIVRRNYFMPRFGDETFADF